MSIWGISNEFLVLNEEAVVAFCLLSVFWAIGKYGGPMYTEWADGQIAKLKGILHTARQDHTSAVKSRIENVKQMGGVVDVTKQLFEVSKVRQPMYNDLVYTTELTERRKRLRSKRRLSS